eukprot:m.4309 g.4309  ORF g.4309 m.4309 type:complete len:94 (-) comp6847_c0_seq1:721-1002(-)
MDANDVKPDIKAEENYVNLKVMGQDGAEVHFKIKKTTTMKKLKEAYCGKKGLNSASVRLSFDGATIQDTDTPTSLDMEDNDKIDVFQQQTGGC